MRAIRKFPVPHPVEQIQIFFNRAVAEGTVFAGLRQRAAVLPDFIGAQAAYVRLAFLNELNRVIVELFKIIRSIIQTVFPVKPQPADIFLNGLHIFDFFLAGIGVIKAQVADAAEFGRQTEIQADGFGMTDVQIAVWLRRKPGHDLPVVFVGLKVIDDDVSNKIR